MVFMMTGALLLCDEMSDKTIPLTQSGRGPHSLSRYYRTHCPASISLREYASRYPNSPCVLVSSLQRLRFATEHFPRDNRRKTSTEDRTMDRRKPRQGRDTALAEGRAETPKGVIFYFFGLLLLYCNSCFCA